MNFEKNTDVLASFRFWAGLYTIMCIRCSYSSGYFIVSHHPVVAQIDDPKLTKFKRDEI